MSKEIIQAEITETPKKKTRAVAIKKNVETPVISNNPMALLTQATKQGASVETLEKLMGLQERWEKNEAKKAFDAAMSKFQAECPVIKKTKKVLNKGGASVRYVYAPLDSIVSQVKKALTANNLSYSFDEEKDEKFTNVICIAKHIDGHSEKTGFKIPIGTEEFMNDVQKYGARMTFGKRYAFCNAFGILTGDDDTDARGFIGNTNTGFSFEKFKEIIAKSDKKTLEDYAKKLKTSDKYTPEQKEEADNLITARLADLEA